MTAQRTRGVRYTFTHQIQFKDNTETLPYRSARWWKTSRGALRAAEQHAQGTDQYYDNVRQHALTVLDDCGRFITNEAA